MRFFFQYGMFLYGAANLWIIWWFWRALRGKTLFRVLFCALLAVLAGAFPLLFRQTGASLPELFLLRAGSVWLGTVIYLFAMVVLAEVIALIRAVAHQIKAPYTKRRHSYVPFWCVLTLTVLVVFGGFAIAALPKVNEITVVVPVGNIDAIKLPDKTLHIAAISDVHLGRLVSAEFLADALERLVRYKPDVLFVLGDLIDDRIVLDGEKVRRAFAQLSPRFGIWGVMGNHEYISGSPQGAVDFMEAAGIKVLRDSDAILGDSVLVVGRDDYSKPHFTGEPRKALPEILADLPEAQKKLPLIVLDHQPRDLGDAEQAGAVLQLSGHTHNAQLWPFNYVTNRVYENARGLSTRGGTNYFVTTGTGTWGPRARNNARPEVVVIHLRFEPRA